MDLKVLMVVPLTPLLVRGLHQSIVHTETDEDTVRSWPHMQSLPNERLSSCSSV